MTVISVEHVWKKFRAGKGRHYLTVREAVSRKASVVVDNDPSQAIKGWFWAVKDVSFEVEQGQVLGIIGANGSGKSTMLKMLARVTGPTDGTMHMRGHVGSLLEVGTGFHPELTGRDNVFFNGAVLGMRRADITRHFDEIVEFSGCGAFIDTPVKHYSSGMTVRLAFSVASFLRTDILLIDEVLAVGDADFQRRCLGRMSDLASGGRTVVFVSHNLRAINQLCSDVLWLDRGVVRSIGGSSSVIAEYLKDGSMSAGQFVPAEQHDPRVTLLIGEVLDPSGVPNPIHDAQCDLHLRVRYRIEQPIERLSMGVLVVSLDGAILLDARDSDEAGFPERREVGEYVFDCWVPGPLLVAGQYVVTLYAAAPGAGWLANHRSALSIDVEDPSRSLDLFGGRRLGLVQPATRVTTEQIEG